MTAAVGSVEPQGGLSSSELKSSLQKHLKENGSLRTLKTQLRTMVLADMAGSHRGGGGVKEAWGEATAAMAADRANSSAAAAPVANSSEMEGTGGAFSQRLADDLVELHLRATDRSYSHSVFVSEVDTTAGDGEHAAGGGAARGDAMADSLFVESLGLPAGGLPNGVSPLTYVVKRVVSQTTRKEVNSLAVQTLTDAELHPLSLEHKLAMVDSQHALKVSKANENSALRTELIIKKYKEEESARLRDQMRVELERWKATELIAMRGEEEAKYQMMVESKTEEYKSSLAAMEHRAGLEQKRVEDIQRSLTQQELILERRAKEIITEKKESDDLIEGLQAQLSMLREKSRQQAAQLTHYQDLCADRLHDIERLQMREVKKTEEINRARSEYLQELRLRDEELAALKYKMQVLSESQTRQMAMFPTPQQSVSATSIANLASAMQPPPPTAVAAPSQPNANSALGGIRSAMAPSALQHPNQVPLTSQPYLPTSTEAPVVTSSSTQPQPIADLAGLGFGAVGGVQPLGGGAGAVAGVAPDGNNKPPLAPTGTTTTVAAGATAMNTSSAPPTAAAIQPLGAAELILTNTSSAAAPAMDVSESPMASHKTSGAVEPSTGVNLATHTPQRANSMGTAAGSGGRYSEVTESVDVTPQQQKVVALDASAGFAPAAGVGGAANISGGADEEEDMVMWDGESPVHPRSTTAGSTTANSASPTAEQQDEAAAVAAKQKKDEEDAAEQKRKDDEAAAQKKRDDEAAAAAAKKKREEEEQAEAQKAAEEAAAAKKKKEEEDALAKEKKDFEDKQTKERERFEEDYMTKRKKIMDDEDGDFSDEKWRWNQGMSRIKAKESEPDEAPVIKAQTLGRDSDSDSSYKSSDSGPRLLASDSSGYESW